MISKKGTVGNKENIVEGGFVLVGETKTGNKKRVQFCSHSEGIQGDYVVIDPISNKMNEYRSDNDKRRKKPKGNYNSIYSQESSSSSVYNKKSYEIQLKKLSILIEKLKQNDTGVRLENILTMTNNYIVGNCTYLPNITKIWKARMKKVEIDGNEADELGLCSEVEYQKMEGIIENCRELLKVTKGDYEKVSQDVKSLFKQINVEPLVSPGISSPN